MQFKPNQLFSISIRDSSKNNRLLSMNRSDGRPNVMVIDKILSEVIHHSERQSQSINERIDVLEEYSKVRALLSSSKDMHPFCGYTFNRSTSAYASKKRSRRTMHQFERGVQIKDRNHPGTSDIDIEISDSHLVHKFSIDKYQPQNQSDLCSSHYQKRKTKLPICYRHFPLPSTSFSKCKQIRTLHLNRSHSKQKVNQWRKDLRTNIAVDIRKVPCEDMYSKEENDNSSMLFEQEDIDGDEPIHLSRRNWDDEISSASVFKQFSHSPLFSDSKLEEIVGEDLLTNLETLESNQSVTLLLPQNAWERSDPFDRRSACILSRIDGVRRMSTIQLASPAITLPGSLSEHQSVLSIKSMGNSSNEQNEQSQRLKNALIEADLNLTVPNPSSIKNDSNDSDNLSDRDYHEETMDETIHVLHFLLPTDQTMLDSNSLLRFNNAIVSKWIISLTEDQILNTSDLENVSDLLAENRQFDHSVINTIERQDGDRNEMEKNLIKYKEDDPESNSNLVISLDLSQETITTSHGAHEQDIIPSSSSADLTLLSDDDKGRFVLEREKQFKAAGEVPYDDDLQNHKGQLNFDVNVSIDTSLPMEQDRILLNELIDENETQVDTLKYSPADLSVTMSPNDITHYGSIDEVGATVALQKENPTIHDDLHIAIPRCTQLCDSFKQIIDRSSDALPFSTGKFLFPRNINDEGKSSIHEDEHDTIRHIVTNQSKTSLFGRNTSPSSVTSSLGTKMSSYTSPIELDVLENRQHLVDDADFSAEISIESASTAMESAKNKHPTDDLDISPIMTITRQTTDDNLTETDQFNSRQKQTKYYVKNLYFDVQSDRLSINTSSRLLRKPTRRKKKPALYLLPTHSSRRTTFIQPPWISTHTRVTPRFLQVKDPCQIFELHTQFQCIHCQPYTCLCTPLHPYKIDLA